jgi:hypothetical protein
MLSSVATRQRTGTFCEGIPPSASKGLGASLVQRTTSSGNGSPEATPSLNG